jgi:hypothetical protein
MEAVMVEVVEVEVMGAVGCGGTRPVRNAEFRAS